MTQLVYLSDAFSKVTGFAFAEKPTTKLKLDEGLLESLELTVQMLDGLKAELEFQIRTLVNDTFSAIFK